MSSMKYQASDISRNSTSDLSFDIISNILLKLPVKPLLRFKSVSKTWYAFIENPHFIKKHYTRSKQNLNLTSVLVFELPLLQNEFAPDQYPTYNMLLTYKNNETINLGHNFSFGYLPHVMGICEGLVFFTLRHSEYFICNPTTRCFRKILSPSLPRVEKVSEIMGFWIHDNDYKLFRIMYSEVGFQAEVYSMNNDIWSEIEVNTRSIDIRMPICVAMSVAVNEVFYWRGPERLASFDINGYNFGTIDFPEEITMRMCLPDWRIHDVKGELALTVSVDECFKMWVLNEKERSWTMKIKVDDLPLMGQSLSLLGCERNGNLIMLHDLPDRDKVLLSYDLESHKITHLPFQGFNHRSVIYMYTESLLSV